MLILFKKFGKTPLMYAAQGGHLSTVKILVEGNADIAAKDNVVYFIFLE